MKKKRLLVAVFILLIALFLWTVWGNTALELNRYQVSSSRLPKAFDGFKIVQISDLHNTQIGDNNETLIQMIKDANPDIIAITGDMIDSRRTDVKVALDFAEEAVKIAPCYYVNGNHELRVSEYEELREGLNTIGVKILENDKTEITKNGEKISLLGLSDPSFEASVLMVEEDEVAEIYLDKMTAVYLDKLTLADNNFKILLSHRPELFEEYYEAGIDLALSGHAHGGQIRLPLVGGIIAPHQGLFPEYDGGLYIKEDTHMVVSRGIGNSLFPLRFNNRPEVVLIELQSEVD